MVKIVNYSMLNDVIGISRVVLMSHRSMVFVQWMKSTCLQQTDFIEQFMLFAQHVHI